MSRKQEPPQREHAVMAMLSMIHMLPESAGRSERGMMMEAMISFVFRAWGWNVQKLKEELDACKAAIQESHGTLVTGFGPGGEFHFEFKAPK